MTWLMKLAETIMKMLSKFLKRPEPFGRTTRQTPWTGVTKLREISLAGQDYRSTRQQHAEAVREYCTASPFGGNDELRDGPDSRTQGTCSVNHSPRAETHPPLPERAGDKAGDIESRQHSPRGTTGTPDANGQRIARQRFRQGRTSPGA